MSYDIMLHNANARNERLQIELKQALAKCDELRRAAVDVVNKAIGGGSAYGLQYYAVEKSVIDGLAAVVLLDANMEDDR